ncbi:hypothetical protein H9W90_07345 [Polaribacter pectinis]|uniref:Uncharacterized protein n=1 Tax=Polaribacter pectinis TaxID=2738844 RepID=A0A7G9LEU7_9FLAO|nr:hypothetical protein [Polaribacter pectinis]QNM87146.1 hypothetical protein H9W90_07345 [Polaribacter pectinis]
MKTNKLDNNIKNKFDNRTIEPSASAWERLSVQLDEQPKQKKKGWFFYIGAAASILLLVSIGIQLFSDNSEEITPKNEVVIEQIDKVLIDEKLDKLKNEIPVEEAIVKTNKVEEKQEVKKNIIPNNIKSKRENSIKEIIKKNNTIIVAKVEEKDTNVILTKEELEFKNTLKKDPNSRIKINSDDLLFAVTHSPQEVKNYYAKYNINRDDVLKTIQNQLKESNLKVNPETILAEVERTIDDDDFQNNFLKSLKRKVSDIATAIASRND